MNFVEKYFEMRCILNFLGKNNLGHFSHIFNRNVQIKAQNYNNIKKKVN